MLWNTPSYQQIGNNNLNKKFSNTIKSSTLHGAFVQPLAVITDGHVKAITKLIIGWTVHCSLTIIHSIKKLIINLSRTRLPLR